MANMNDIGIIVHCGGVFLGLQRVDRRTDYNDLLRLLSGMTGLDLNIYSLKVSAKYPYTSDIYPITCNRDLWFFFDPNADLRSVELFVEQEMILPPQNSHLPMNDVFNQYASYITGESERPTFTNVNANNDREFTRGVDDIPCDAFGPNDPPNSEPEDDEGYLDDEDHPFEGHNSTFGDVQPQSATVHPSLSRASFFDSPYQDVPIDSIGIPAADLTYDDDVGDLQKGMVFSNKDQLKAAVKNYSIRHALREYAVTESTPRIWRVVCKQNAGVVPHDNPVQECNWFLRGIYKKKSGHWKISQMGPHHTCLIDSTHTRHRNLCMNLIAGMLESKVKINPAYQAKDARVDVFNQYNYEVSYHMAWISIKRAVENVYGTWEISCQYLPKFMRALRSYNPDTIVEWKHKDHNPATGVFTLGYVFWAFKPCIDAFQHCRKVITVDGTHLYTKYKHKLLIAMIIDANQQIIPLAFVIVDEETKVA
ncbi:hypothetical protein ACS0TY_028609 [Phlomoides rotata]